MKRNARVVIEQGLIIAMHDDTAPGEELGTVIAYQEEGYLYLTDAGGICLSDYAESLTEVALEHGLRLAVSPTRAEAAKDSKIVNLQSRLDSMVLAHKDALAEIEALKKQLAATGKRG